MFTPIKNTTVSEKVVEQIKDMLSKGNLNKGDRLPSERQMAETLEVSRSSVREALRELEMMGLIESRQGEGNFIKSNFEDILFEPFSTIFLIKESNAKEILELRNVIEKGTVVLAAERITADELEDIRKILDTAEDLDSEEELAKLDIIFHYKIAQASKNFLLQSILNAVSSLIEASIKDIRKNIMIKEEHKEIIKKQHLDIYESLESHNPKIAERAMSNHLDFVNNEMKKSII
ncbi:FadR/GntR family transcriptional regulator [Tissierella praeacuta]|uniref:Transcriptional regulator, GntR family n=1 Tax=Tissierella praeacuta DSM 18095 TaxID=1123404 RepID=A0A1M4TIK2_9FIRM|nr:FadR/GntR family transcriptional regulator [Tissierella praeacuta]MBU5256923.1 FadR family transcriptional regulator [Tissierella praeacuta]TCU77504.1 GntR family transcriptional regulator [Tissierella praeacuta]SHE44235.1 transcriptional regulator, GntR family [Tissierella praeacuta DSM 18095]SUP04603.1 L-lactate utilization operon repressor [Tissierella praeacuta]